MRIATGRAGTSAPQRVVEMLYKQGAPAKAPMSHGLRRDPSIAPSTKERPFRRPFPASLVSRPVFCPLPTDSEASPSAQRLASAPYDQSSAQRLPARSWRWPRPPSSMPQPRLAILHEQPRTRSPPPLRVATVHCTRYSCTQGRTVESSLAVLHTAVG